jgi:hypothetical protein
MTTRTLDPSAGTAATFALVITRRVYAIDCMTGQRLGFYVRNWTLVG